MKFFRMIPLVFAFAAICVGDALGAPLPDESAPPVQSVSPVQSDFRVAQAGGPPLSGGDFATKDFATKDDIRWLSEQNERRWSELHNDLSTFKNTVVAILGGIILGILMAMLFQDYSRGRDKGKSGAM